MECVLLGVSSGFGLGTFFSIVWAKIKLANCNMDSANLQTVHWLPLRLICSSSTLVGTVKMQVGHNIPYAEFVQISPAYICKSCGYVLRDAMQTPCGHHYCEPCINRIFEHAPWVFNSYKICTLWAVIHVKNKKSVLSDLQENIWRWLQKA